MNTTPTISEAARRAAQEICDNWFATEFEREDCVNNAAAIIQSALDSAHPAPKEGATPETDAVAKAIGSLACQWRGGSIDAVQFEQAAQAEMNKLGQLELRLSEAKREVEAYRKAGEGKATCGEMSCEECDREKDSLRTRCEELQEDKKDFEHLLAHLDKNNVKYDRAAIRAARKEGQQAHEKGEGV